jgi:biopolymer transport protein ExbB
MNIRFLLMIALAMGVMFAAPCAMAQDDVSAGGSAGGSFEAASDDVKRQLEEAMLELDALRVKIADDTIPLNRRLSELETELLDVRLEYRDVSRKVDARLLATNGVRNEIESRQEEIDYLSNLLADFIRNLEAGLHIAELQRYQEPLDVAKLAPENVTLSKKDIFAAQSEILDLSLDRLEEALGGTRFAGTAVAPDGLVKPGTFVLVGPAAVFRSDDGTVFGTAEQRVSLEPTIVPFLDERNGALSSALVADGKGTFLLDPTLGDAHQIAATEETIVEHVKRGGPVMVPIFIMAAAALVVALFKWISFLFVRRPSRRTLRHLLAAVTEGDRAKAVGIAKSVRGPTGRMLVAGVEHLAEPRELIEEIMYETVLTTRLSLQRFLPFIAICAASAPLLGLLGTVTGIINTFKLITVFGSSDVKTLSGGISEALITTECGLIVAIPALLIHAYLARKARSVVDDMEQAGLALVNAVDKQRHGRDARRDIEVPDAPSSPSSGRPQGDRLNDPASQLRDILGELLAGPNNSSGGAKSDGVSASPRENPMPS